jgi:hypothetical protein
MKKNKRRRVQNHAKARAYQRYNLEINGEARREILKKIQNNETKGIKHYSNRKILHMVNYNSQIIFVIYSKKHKQILTFLPRDCDEFQEFLNVQT